MAVTGSNHAVFSLHDARHTESPSSDRDVR
jgi:hypothetical protein